MKGMNGKPMTEISNDEIVDKLIQHIEEFSDKKDKTMNEKNIKSLSELDANTVVEINKYLSEFIPKMSYYRDRLKYMCDSYDYDDEISYTISEALEKCGLILATLNQWMIEDKLSY